MSTTATLAKMKQDQKKIEGMLEEIRAEKGLIDNKYNSVIDEENKIYDQLRGCRDAYVYDRLQIKLNSVSRRRKEVETEKKNIEMKIRGYEEELEQIKARIKYMKPKGTLVTHKN